MTCCLDVCVATGASSDQLEIQKCVSYSNFSHVNTFFKTCKIGRNAAECAFQAGNHKKGAKLN